MTILLQQSFPYQETDQLSNCALKSELISPHFHMIALVALNHNVDKVQVQSRQSMYRA